MLPRARPLRLLRFSPRFRSSSARRRSLRPKTNTRSQEDVKAGREAAREVEQQLPMLRDDGVDDYVERIGQRLAEAIPNEFQHPEFRYSFDVVNVSDLNAFALPGGPMYINRGMLRGGEERRRSCRRARARDQPRGAASRHGTGGQGDPLSSGLDSWTDCGRDYRRRGRVRPFRSGRSSASGRRF